jgi:mannose-6-phosphate isomerase-like protein (cupin superfamily)
MTEPVVPGRPVLPALSALTGFPGATSVSELNVYETAAPDGLAGGTPHLHTVSAEAYLVIAGHGRLQTIDGSGFAEHPLEPGALIWFGPGVIHRAVNDDALSVRVIMQNAGLPEAGDAVMTFPDEVLADPERYRAAATLPGPERSEDDRLAAALLRRDLAVEGFLALRDGEAIDDARLGALYERAVALVSPRSAHWREQWQDGALAAAMETGERLDALDTGRDPGLARGRVSSVAASAAFGMCGRLRRYEGAGPSSRPSPHSNASSTPEHRDA